MPKKVKKEVRIGQSKSEKRKVLKIIHLCRNKGMTWGKICRQITEELDIYISPAALQQRYSYFLKSKADSRRRKIVNNILKPTTPSNPVDNITTSINQLINDKANEKLVVYRNKALVGLADAVNKIEKDLRDLRTYIIGL